MVVVEAPRIIIVPSLGVGHLTPLIEFAKVLVHRHGFNITFLVPTDAPPSSAYRSVLSALPSAINHHFLPPINFSDLPPTAGAESRVTLSVTRSVPYISAALRSLPTSASLAAIVVDLFGTDAFQVAEEFNISRYVFFTSTAMALSLLLHLPTLDVSISGEYRDLPDPIRIPGCIPIHGFQLLDPLQNRKNDDYYWVLYNAKRFRLANGIFINSFTELEAAPFASLLGKDADHPTVYPVGPIVKRVDLQKSEIGRWLDDQPERSVLYASFGSGGTLSQEQFTELALGLEESGQRFIWVARSPNQTAANAGFFTAATAADPFVFLPEGFLERTKGRGLVVATWAPQTEVLSHGSTGGFLTHCGWNSTLEALVEGVPMVAWPLYAEQKMNAAMMVDEGMGVALQAAVGDGGVVGRREVARVVRELIEGEKGKRVREKVAMFRDAAVAATADGGSSSRSLAEVARKWRGENGPAFVSE